MSSVQLYSRAHLVTTIRVLLNVLQLHSVDVATIKDAAYTKLFTINNLFFEIVIPQHTRFT